MPTEPTTPAEHEAVLLRIVHRLAPAPAWPRGLAVEMVLGRRRRVKRLVKAEPGPWVELGFGPVRAAVRIRPAE